MFSHRYRYLFIIAISLYTFLNTVICDVYYYFKIDIEWYFAMLTILLITLFVWEGSRLMEPYIKRNTYNGKGPIRFLLLFFLYGNVIAFMAATSVVAFIGPVLHQYPLEKSIEPLKLNVIYAGLVNLFFHLLNAIFFFFDEYRKKLLETEELKRTSTVSQLQLIKSQINPHFLFNSLNVLSGMVVKDNPEANRYIEEFSKVYRYILSHQDKELVPLETEMEFIKPYIFLLEKRFPGAVKFDINIDETAGRLHIIPVAIQMIIENAIKHNVASKSKPLCISVETNEKSILSIRNNLQPKQSIESSTQIGLKNIKKRYELVSGKDVVVMNSDTVFEVQLPLLQLN